MFLDADMTFDATTQRFYLTDYYVQNKLGIDLKAIASDELDTQQSTLPERQIEYACDLLWDFIDENAYDKKSTHYYLACNELAYKTLKKALMNQLMFVVEKGDLTKDIGNNVNDSIDKSAIRKLNTISAFHIKIRIIPDVENW